MTTSSAEQDIFESYDLHANCYLTKPVELDDFISVVRKIEDFWLTIVKLPRSLTANLKRQTKDVVAAAQQCVSIGRGCSLTPYQRTSRCDALQFP